MARLWYSLYSCHGRQELGALGFQFLNIFVNHGKDWLLVSSCISVSSKSSVIDHPIKYLDALEFLSLPFGIILEMIFSCLARDLKMPFPFSRISQTTMTVLMMVYGFRKVLLQESEIRFSTSSARFLRRTRRCWGLCDSRLCDVVSSKFTGKVGWE